MSRLPNLSNIQVMIAIVTYNGENYIKDCLNSIVTKSNCQIHVLDNNSTDRTTTIVEKEFPNVHLTRSSDNLGFGKANNFLLELACQKDLDYVFLLNQDAYFIGECLDKLLISAQKFGNQIYSPVHFKKDELTLDEGFSSYTQEGKNFNKLDFVNAAAWLIPISIVRLVGGFSPLFYHYGEDRDYANRLMYYGHYFCVIEEAKLVHNREQKPWVNNKENLLKYSNRFYINMLRYFTDINRGLLFCILITTKNTLGDFINQMISGKWKLGVRNLGMYLWCYTQLGMILKCRRISKTQNGAFLKIT